MRATPGASSVPEADRLAMAGKEISCVCRRSTSGQARQGALAFRIIGRNPLSHVARLWRASTSTSGPAGRDSSRLTRDERCSGCVSLHPVLPVERERRGFVVGDHLRDRVSIHAVHVSNPPVRRPKASGSSDARDIRTIRATSWDTLGWCSCCALWAGFAPCRRSAASRLHCQRALC